MGRKIGVGTVNISARGKKYLLDVVDNNRLSYGKYSARFEAMFARMHGCRYGILSNSGTSALQVALDAMKKLYKWADGDEVIVPALTFVASVNVILQNRLKPVFVDVDPDYFELDPGKIEVLITPRTRAIMAVHLFGQPADMPGITRVARRHGLRIIEDSCETMLARQNGRSVGSFGDVACFSTFSAHLITTGVGGITTTNNSRLLKLIQSLMNHGRNNIYISLEDDDNVKHPRFKIVMKNRFNFVHLGYSYRLTEMEAAIGLSQLEEYKKIIGPRKTNAAYLTRELSVLQEYLDLPKIRSGSDHVFMVYPMVLKDKRTDLDDLLLYLEKNGIETRYLLPILNQPVYKELRINKKLYPVANRLTKRGFYIGCHQDLKKTDLDYMISVFRKFFLPKHR